MSRSGYVDDYIDDPLEHGRWRGRVASAIRGRRGQKFLRDLVSALDAMPERRLVEGAFETEAGVCAAGAVGRLRGVTLADLNPDEEKEEAYYCDVNSPWNVEAAERLDVALPLIAEVEAVNDSDYPTGDEEARWHRVRAWAMRHLKVEGE